MPDARPFRTEPDGIRLFARITPNASADRIEGAGIRDDGSVVLRIRVRAVPDRGKANAAVIALLSRTLHVPKSAIELVSGDTTRLKTFVVAGDPGQLAARLSTL